MRFFLTIVFKSFAAPATSIAGIELHRNAKEKTD